MMKPSSRIQTLSVWTPGVKTSIVATTESIVLFDQVHPVPKLEIRSAVVLGCPSIPMWQESSLPVGPIPRTQTVWIPVLTNAGIPHFKWRDWCESMDLTFEPTRIRRLARLRSKIPGYLRIETRIVSEAFMKIMQRGRMKLSDDKMLDQRLEQLFDKIELLKEDIARDKYSLASHI